MIYTPGGKFLLRGGKVVLNAADCCCEKTCADCPSMSTCAFCPGTTPTAFNILFGAVAGTPKCVYETGGTLYVYTLVLNIAGMSFDLPQSASPCVYELTLPAGLVQFMRCAACSGGTDIATSALMRLTVNSAVMPQLEIVFAFPPIGPLGATTSLTVLPKITGGTTDAGADRCCDPCTRYNASSDGTENPCQEIVGGSHTTTPCEGA